MARTLAATEPSPLHLPVTIAMSRPPLCVGNTPGTVLRFSRAAPCPIDPGEFLGAALHPPGAALHPPGATLRPPGSGDHPGAVLCPPEPRGRPQNTYETTVGLGPLWLDTIALGDLLSVVPDPVPQIVEVEDVGTSVFSS